MTEYNETLENQTIIKDDSGLFYSNPKNYSFWGVNSITSDIYFNHYEKDSKY